MHRLMSRFQEKVSDQPDLETKYQLYTYKYRNDDEIANQYILFAV